MKTLLRAQYFNDFTAYTLGSLEDKIVPSTEQLDKFGKLLREISSDHKPILISGAEVTIAFDEDSSKYIFTYGNAEYNIRPKTEDIEHFRTLLSSIAETNNIEFELRSV